MTEEIANLTLEHLRALRSDMQDVKNRLSGVEVNLAMLGQQVGALTTAIYSGKSDVSDLRERVERIERRLELSNA
jgi:predicted  nucleic acid-binding Zn-ribbon protein